MCAFDLLGPCTNMTRVLTISLQRRPRHARSNLTVFVGIK
jgi:hypothetical protein